MTRAKVVGRPVQRTIVGQPAAVEKQLWAMKTRGDLVAGQPMPVVRQLSDGRVAIAVRVVDRSPTPRPRRRVRVRWVAAGGVATAGLVGVGYLVYLAWAWILGAVVLAAVVWVLLGQRAACPGLHCPGCKCHR